MKEERERERERKKEKERGGGREGYEREKRGSVAFCKHHLGMCSDQGSNLQPFGV